MNLLLDTHILIWAAHSDPRLSGTGREMIADPANTVWFSVVGIWEVAIKRARNREDFRIEAAPLRAGLLANGYNELPVEGRHVLALANLPPLHSDPFDRLLVAQAMAEGLVLLTADKTVANYGGFVRLV